MSMEDMLSRAQAQLLGRRTQRLLLWRTSLVTAASTEGARSHPSALRLVHALGQVSRIINLNLFASFYRAVIALGRV